ncbi:MAG: hypothetical protein AB1571_02085 [Nanoarchaeota archaeon]
MDLLKTRIRIIKNITNKIIESISEPRIKKIANKTGKNKAKRILYLNLTIVFPLILICDVFTKMNMAIRTKA